MQAEAWQPFEDTACLLSLRGESGLVLAWDRMRVQQDMAAFVAEPRRCRLVPEPMLRQVGADGARLVRCLEGVEAQIWRDGWLQASRWWPDAPGEQEWRLFLHASATPELAKIERPAVEEAAWLDRPWSALRGMEGDAGPTVGLERRMVVVGALVLVMGAAAVGRQTWDVSQAIAQRDREISALRESAAEVLAKRDRALERAAEAQRLAIWLSEPLPIEVILHLHDTLSKSGVQLKEMELNGNKLRIGLQLSLQATRSAIVRDLQSGNWFKNVSEVGASSGNGLMVLDMSLDGLRPAPRPSGPAALGSTTASPTLPAIPLSPAANAGGRP